MGTGHNRFGSNLVGILDHKEYIHKLRIENTYALDNVGTFHPEWKTRHHYIEHIQLVLLEFHMDMYSILQSWVVTRNSEDMGYILWCFHY